MQSTYPPPTNEARETTRSWVQFPDGVNRYLLDFSIRKILVGTSWSLKIAVIHPRASENTWSCRSLRTCRNFRQTERGKRECTYVCAHTSAILCPAPVENFDRDWPPWAMSWSVWSLDSGRHYNYYVWRVWHYSAVPLWPQPMELIRDMDTFDRH